MINIAERSFPRDPHHHDDAALPIKDSFRILRFQQVEWSFAGMGVVVISDAAWNVVLFTAMRESEQPFMIIKTLMPDDQRIHMELFVNQTIALKEEHHLQASYICFQFFMNDIHFNEIRSEHQQPGGLLTTVTWRGLHLNLANQLLTPGDIYIPANPKSGIIFHEDELDIKNTLILVDSDATAKILHERYKDEDDKKVACFMSRSKKMVLDKNIKTIICHSTKVVNLPVFHYERLYVYEKAFDSVSAFVAANKAPCFLVLEQRGVVKEALLHKLELVGVEKSLLELARVDITGILMDHLIAFLNRSKSDISKKCLETSYSIQLHER